MIKKPDYATADKLNWPFIYFLVAFHLACIPAIWTFSWEGVAAALILYSISGSIGISFAYHRLLTHGSMKVPKWLTWLGAFCGCLAFEGGPIFWVSTHRYHHKMSDQRFDPHSPRDGFWWAHVGWLMYAHPVLHQPDERKKITPDLHRDPVICWLEANSLWIGLSAFPVLYAIGYAIGGPAKALSLLFYGGFLRVVVVWHVTWLINSATHKWGYRNYSTHEDSTNHWLIALASFGEGWHNNHHGDSRSGVFRHRWFEFDYTYSTFIWPLQKLGLITKLVMPKNANFEVPVTVTEEEHALANSLPEMAPSGISPLKTVSSV